MKHTRELMGTIDLKAAAETWNSLVRESEQVKKAVDALARGKLKPSFYIPGFAKFIVLRPFFISPEQVARVRSLSETVLSAHRKILNTVLSSNVLKKEHFSSFFEWTEDIIKLDRPGPVRAACLRFDGSLVKDNPVFIELNTDMPQAAGLCDSYVGFLSDLPVIEQFRKKYTVEPMMVQGSFLRALLGEWNASGKSGRPTICFLTWRDDPVRHTDMEINRDYCSSRGYNALVADPRNLEFDGDSLSAGGKKIDLVYRVISTAETLQRPDDMKTLIKAEKAGAVLMVNSFRSELMGNKSLFALLHDERFQQSFTAAELEAVRRCVPWTALVREGAREDCSGREVDLVDWVRGNREDLVLKPTHDFGGHKVTMGDSSSQSEWEAALEEALRDDFIVQKKIPMETGLYPVAEEGLPLRVLYEDVDPFMLGYSFAGCISRMSDSEMTNIHLHGAIGAVFVVDRI